MKYHNKEREKIFSSLRQQGKRITKVRSTIIKVLLQAKCLISQKEILQKLEAHNIFPNRSTIFRELIFLINIGLINKNTILDLDHYEIPLEHHHHLICLNCKEIKKITVRKNHLKRNEKKIAQQFQFTITNHQMDYYGYCQNCEG